MDLIKSIGAIIMILFLFEGIKFIFSISTFWAIVVIAIVLGIPYLITKWIG